MAFNVEVCFISKLLETKDISTVKDNQITLQFFTGDNKNAFKFIQDIISSSGEVPTVRVFERTFPNYPLESHLIDGYESVGTDENLKFWCDELRKKAKHNRIVDLIESVAEELRDFQTEDAYSAIKKEIAYIESEIIETSAVDVTQNTEDRVQAYLERKQYNGMRGIPTGFRDLDYCIKGLEDSTLTVLTASTGQGKTWLEVIIGARCQLAAHRVLQLVTEMSAELMRDRYEAVLYSMCYGEFNYSKFKSGRLDSKTEESYFNFLREDLPNFEPLIISTATGVMGVAADIDKYDPDIILIDSAYLMEDDQGAKEDWLRVAHVTRDLKKLAKRVKKPIFINTQANTATSSKRDGPGLNDTMYAKAINQDADTVLSLYRDEVMYSDHEMGIRVLKNREGTLAKMVINWDFSKMDFSDIYCERDGSNEQDDSDIAETPDGIVGDDIL